jgi:hypothetical protein
LPGHLTAREPRVQDVAKVAAIATSSVSTDELDDDPGNRLDEDRCHDRVAAPSFAAFVAHEDAIPSRIGGQRVSALVHEIREQRDRSRHDEDGYVQRGRQAEDGDARLVLAGA